MVASSLSTRCEDILEQNDACRKRRLEDELVFTVVRFFFTELRQYIRLFTDDNRCASN